MKALVLSGGAGTRMRPLTHTMAKQLVPVANKPVIVHCLEAIREIGIEDVGVIVGGRADEIRAALGDGKSFGVRLSYLRQATPAGLAHCVLTAARYLGEDDFLMMLGDNVFASGITAAAEQFVRERPDALIVTKKVANPENFGVAEVDSNGVVRVLVEKPTRPTSDLAVTGAYFFTPAIHGASRAISPSARGELEITDAIALLVATERRVLASPYPGYWADTGTAADLLDCNRVMLGRISDRIEGDLDRASTASGRVWIEPGARVRGSQLLGPVAIAAGSLVEDSVIGPDVAIGRDADVRRATVSDSIVLDGASVRDLGGLTGSIVGRRSQVTGCGRVVGRLAVGDDARMEVRS